MEKRVLSTNLQALSITSIVRLGTEVHTTVKSNMKMVPAMSTIALPMTAQVTVSCSGPMCSTTATHKVMAPTSKRLCSLKATTPKWVIRPVKSSTLLGLALLFISQPTSIALLLITITKCLSKPTNQNNTVNQLIHPQSTTTLLNPNSAHITILPPMLMSLIPLTTHAILEPMETRLQLYRAITPTTTHCSSL